MQRLIRTIYPPQCVMCDAATDAEFALCGSCWSDTPFIDGMCCDACGTPLPGQSDPSPDVLCDDCMTISRPWAQGRAVMVYKDKARRLVLSLKHGDRTDLARTAGPWLARAGQSILTPQTLLVPIPLHRLRLLKRTFNQAALLAEALAKTTGIEHCPDALLRTVSTKSLDGKGRDARFEELSNAVEVNPARADMVRGRDVVLVDDVMTSGATFAAATEACHTAGATRVCVLALARVAKEA